MYVPCSLILKLPSHLYVYTHRHSRSVLAFDALDMKCANHFLARKMALRGIRLCLSLLERSLSATTQSQALALRVRCEAWQVLSEAQNALAHSCVVLYFTPQSAKLQFLFDELASLTTHLQVRVSLSLCVSVCVCCCV